MDVVDTGRELVAAFPANERGRALGFNSAFVALGITPGPDAQFLENAHTLAGNAGLGSPLVR